MASQVARYARKRPYGQTSMSRARIYRPFKPPRLLQRSMAYKRRRFRPGYDRTGGFYGRAGETNFFDTTVADNAAGLMSGGGELMSTSLNLLPEGTTESSRYGRKSVVKSLFIKGVLKLPTTTTPADATDRLRIIVYLDKQCNGAAVTSPSTNILTSATMNSFLNKSNTSRFSILKDVTYSMNGMSGGPASTTTTNYGPVTKFFKLSFPRLNIPIEFSSTTGAITEIRSNNLGVFVGSETAKATLGYTARLNFIP